MKTLYVTSSFTTYRICHKDGSNGENSWQEASADAAYEGHHNGEGEVVIPSGTKHCSGTGRCRLAHHNYISGALRKKQIHVHVHMCTLYPYMYGGTTH